MPTLKDLRSDREEIKAAGMTASNELDALEKGGLESDEDKAAAAVLEEKISGLEADLHKADLAVISAERRADRQRSFAPTRVDIIEDDAPARPLHITSTERDPAKTWGFKSIGDFATSVMAEGHQAVPGGLARQDSRLNNWRSQTPSNFHQEIGSTDGYMVPPEFREEIWNVVFNSDEEDLIDKVTPEMTMSNQVQIIADEYVPWKTTGVQARWRGEGSQMTPSRLDTEGREVKLHELYALVYATDELRQDAPRLEDRLTKQSARAIRYELSNVIMDGNGSGRPLGYMQSDALITHPKTTSQAADTITAENILGMVTRFIDSGSAARPCWVVHPDTLPQLVTLTVGDQPVWMQGNMMLGQPFAMLMGYPVMKSQHARTLGDRGDIQLVDFNGYYALQKAGAGESGLQFDASMHLFFDYNITAYRWITRFGGQPFLSEPVAPDNGSTTMSHFVALAERS